MKYTILLSLLLIGTNAFAAVPQFNSVLPSIQTPITPVNENLNNKIQEYEQRLKDLNSEVENLRIGKNNNDIINFLKKEVTNGEVYEDNGLVVVKLSSMIIERAGNKLSDEARNALKPIVMATTQYADRYDLVVEGHTDGVKPTRHSGFKDNWEVGFARSYQVAEDLQKMKIPQRNLVVASRAGNLPVINNENIEKQVENRRVQFVFVPRRNENISSSNMLQATKKVEVKPILQKAEKFSELPPLPKEPKLPILKSSKQSKSIAKEVPKSEIDKNYIPKMNKSLLEIEGISDEQETKQSEQNEKASEPSKLKILN